MIQSQGFASASKKTAWIIRSTPGSVPPAALRVRFPVSTWQTSSVSTNANQGARLHAVEAVLAMNERFT